LVLLQLHLQFSDDGFGADPALWTISAAASNRLDRRSALTRFMAASRGDHRLVKVSVISATANYLFQDISSHILGANNTMSLVKFTLYYAAAAAAYTGYLYYNFSGYMDIVIAMGALFNQQLPENFNKPFAARSFLEFYGTAGT